MKYRPLLGAALSVLALLLPASAARAGSPGPTDPPDPGPSATAALVPGEVLVRRVGEPLERARPTRPGETVAAATRRLSRRPGIAWAGPNPIARIAAPNDPGRVDRRGGWAEDQWSFLDPPPTEIGCSAERPCGIGAVRAWQRLEQAGRSGGRRPDGSRGPIVAVIDTGVAYRGKGRRFARHPDLARSAVVAPRDFVDGDRVPLDRNGHGTHLAATILARTGNGIAMTGIADGLRLMPVRVLTGAGDGSARNVARGIRYAARKGARVINLSLEFAPRFSSCEKLRGICRALRAAERRGALVVAAAGNSGRNRVQMPALRSFAVAGSTIRGCLAGYTNRGTGLDLTAPGGGRGAPGAGSHCEPTEPGPGIVQLTLSPGATISGRYNRFTYPRFEGSSMAAAHVSAAAGLVASTRVLNRRLGRRPSPVELGRWLECTARTPADPETGSIYGAGLLDLRAALNGNACPEGIDT